MKKPLQTSSIIVNNSLLAPTHQNPLAQSTPPHHILLPQNRTGNRPRIRVRDLGRGVWDMSNQSWHDHRRCGPHPGTTFSRRRRGLVSGSVLATTLASIHVEARCTTTTLHVAIGVKIQISYHDAGFMRKKTYDICVTAFLSTPRAYNPKSFYSLFTYTDIRS
jgi:hypothetical protein